MEKVCDASLVACFNASVDWAYLGRNSIIVILGANLLLNEDDLIKAEEVIRQSKVLVCQLEIRQDTVVKAFELARKHSGMHGHVCEPCPVSVR